jgi:hypothetical protein
MNRSLAQWLAGNPVGAVVATGLLGLLPLLGIGVLFFLPGAVPALIVLVRGERQGVLVALGASLLLALVGDFLVLGVPHDRPADRADHTADRGTGPRLVVVVTDQRAGDGTTEAADDGATLGVLEIGRAHV